MILINSGAYIIPEFQAEIGRIPPCLLPIGNKKLIEHQVVSLRNFFNEKIVVTIPISYSLSSDITQLFDELDVVCIQTQDDFSLSESILFALNVISVSNSEPIRLLHGDTLLLDFQTIKSNCIGVAKSEENYNREKAYTHENITMVWCGFFSFSSKQLLTKSLAIARGDFVAAIKIYDKEISLAYCIFDVWYDLGHVNTYFKSRSKITTERSFNSLDVCDNVLTKRGESKKIKAECLWFSTIPNALKIFVPQLIDYQVEIEGCCYYSLEYLPILPLNELFVHGKKEQYEWIFILRKIKDFMLICGNFDTDTTQKNIIKSDFQSLVYQKTKSRIELYRKCADIDLGRSFLINGKRVPCIDDIVENCSRMVLSLPSSPGVLHGDLCFSNILFDGRSEQLKVIDPRGVNDRGDFTILGDQKYDLAKLTHSVVGLYDYIIAGRYYYHENSPYDLVLEFNLEDSTIALQQDFLTSPFLEELTPQQILPLVVLLFLSMLPLHSDRVDRQKAMLANALRLYTLIS